METHCDKRAGPLLEALSVEMMEEATGPDDDLIRHVLAGDTECFESLMVRHRDHVRRSVSGHVPFDKVADIVHEVFIL